MVNPGNARANPRDATRDRAVAEGDRVGRVVRSLPYRAGPDGVRLSLRLTPRASRTGLDGLVADAEGGVAVQVRVAAPPVEGAANAALIAYLSETLGLRRSDLRVVAGEASRRKVVHLCGDASAITARLAAWIADAPTRR